MGRRLVDRRVCGECGQVVETLDDGTEVGHVAPHGPPTVPEGPAPEPEGAAAEAAANLANDLKLAGDRERAAAGDPATAQAP